MAKKIKDEADKFLREILKVEMSQEKTKITHLSQDKAQYLGFYVSRRSRMYTESQKSYIKSTGKSRRPTYSSVIIEAPIDKLLKKLVEQGFA